MKKLLLFLTIGTVISLNEAEPNSTVDSFINNKTINFSHEIKTILDHHERLANGMRDAFVGSRAESDNLKFIFGKASGLRGAYRNYTDSITNMKIACHFNKGAHDLYNNNCLNIQVNHTNTTMEKSHPAFKCFKILKKIVKMTLETISKAKVVIDESLEIIPRNLDEVLSNIQKSNFSLISLNKMGEVNEEKRINGSTSFIGSSDNNETIPIDKSKMNDPELEKLSLFDTVDHSRVRHEWTQNVTKDLKIKKDFTAQVINNLDTTLKFKQEWADVTENLFKGSSKEELWLREKFDELQKSVSMIHEMSCEILKTSNNTL